MQNFEFAEFRYPHLGQVFPCEVLRNGGGETEDVVLAMPDVATGDCAGAPFPTMSDVVFSNTTSPTA